MTPYVERILSLLGDEDPIEILRATPGRLEHLHGVLGSDGLERRYAPGKWRGRDILAHLADAELGMGFRVRQVIAGEGIQPFDQDAWARRYDRLEPSLAVEAFRGLRAWNLALYATFELRDWVAEAHHPERGPESVDVMVRFLAGHDLNHLVQLEQLLELR
jgi:hypothetical protein